MLFRSNGQHQLAVPAQTVYVLFLKINRYPQFLQFTHRFQQRHRIAGETADGLGEYPVDLSCPAVCQQPLKLRAIVLRPGQRLVYLVTLHNTIPQIAKAPESPCGSGFSGALRCLSSLKKSLG